MEHLFNASWYLARYPDVAAAGLNPLEHFIAHGASEGRDPNPLFDTDWYLTRYPDVAADGVNPLEHFIAHGTSEGRDPNPLFDTDWYLARYPDIAESKVNWLEHFIHTGLSEQRHPGPLYAALSIDAMMTLKPLLHNKYYEPIGDQKSRVTIVIPVHGQWYLTERCLRALEHTEAMHLADIVVVNDKSPDNTLEKLKAFPKVVIRDLEKNLGFTLASNAGAAGAETEFLLFLNNDTEPLPGFLDSLIRAADRDQEAALVGSRLVFPNGLLQESGSIIWSDGTGYNYGRGGSVDDAEYQATRDVDYCSGASLLVRTEFFSSLGGFDHRYAPAYYEDTDLAFAARAKGFRVLVAPRSVVIHHEGGSHGTDTSTGIKAKQVTNHVKFCEKWSDSLTRQPRYGEFPLRFVASRKTTIKPVLLFVDADFIDPRRDAGSLRQLRIMEASMQLGYEVVFVSCSRSSFGEPANHLREKGILVLTSESEFIKFVSEENAWIAAIFVSRVGVAFEWMPLFSSQCPEIPVIFDTVDLHHLRELQQASLLKSALLKLKAAGTKRREFHVINHSSATLVVNRNEVTYLKGALPDAVVHHIGLTYDIFEHNANWSTRRGLSFVGSFSHSPNVDGLIWFIDEVWPLLGHEIQEEGLVVIGADPPQELLNRATDEITFVGFVPDTSKYLQQVKVSVAPLRFGAGSKGKVCEAWANGLPVVGTTVALEGMIDHSNPACLIADLPAEFATKVTLVHGNESLWMGAQEGALAVMRKDYSIASMRASIDNLLSSLSQDSIVFEH